VSFFRHIIQVVLVVEENGSTVQTLLPLFRGFPLLGLGRRFHPSLGPGITNRPGTGTRSGDTPSFRSILDTSLRLRVHEFVALALLSLTGHQLIRWTTNLDHTARERVHLVPPSRFALGFSSGRLSLLCRGLDPPLRLGLTSRTGRGAGLGLAPTLGSC